VRCYDWRVPIVTCEEQGTRRRLLFHTSASEQGAWGETNCVMHSPSNDDKHIPRKNACVILQA